MKNFVVFLVFAVLAITQCTAKSVICSVIAKDPGPNGYEKVHSWSDFSDPICDRYYLRCDLPGSNPCVWPDDMNAPCPTVFNKPVPDNLQLEDDNGDPIDVSASVINGLVCQALLGSETSGAFMIGDLVQVFFSIEVLSNGDRVLQVTCLTDGDILQ